jgi:hypothetical protein
MKKTCPILCSKLLLSAFVACLIAIPGPAQNFPPLNITISDSAASSGYYFLSPYTNASPYIYDHAHLILDRLGKVVYYRSFEEYADPNPTIDFKLQPNGQISYFNIERKKFFMLDSTFTLVDSIGCTHGYATDQRDMQILPNNHYLLFGTEVRIMNLSAYHWFGFGHNQPGATNAQVSGVVIQEFNEDKNLVWEWKSHDHYLFGDGDSIWYSNPNKVDWTHANAVERDWDGNILISLRHFNEITKIDHETGDIIWRFGGRRNQFNFLEDPVRFSGQHDIRRVNATTVSLFDNGQYSSPQRCRAVEYVLDEVNLIANLTWSYSHDPAMFSVACGSHQHVANGNHVADFGFTNGIFPWMAVVKSDKSRVLEISYPQGYISYRAFNYPTLPWALNQPVVECMRTGGEYFLVAEPGHPEYHWNTGDTTASIAIADTGEYWVAVPLGEGYICSEHVYITDLIHPCIVQQVPPSETINLPEIRCIPNPANSQTKLFVTLPASATIELTLSDIAGKAVVKLANGFFPQGDHEFHLDASTLNPGIYTISLITHNSRIVSKLVVY